MNSEKVKEIKKALVQNIKSGLGYEDNDKFCNVMLADILTLINELESENESCYEVLADLKAIIKQQSDRIAELEKEIKGNAFYAKGYAQGIKNTYEVVVPDKLKQFAERLKEKMSEGEYLGQKYKLTVFRDIDIDETLNEFLKGENNE